MSLRSFARIGSTAARAAQRARTRSISHTRPPLKLPAACHQPPALARHFSLTTRRHDAHEKPTPSDASASTSHAPAEAAAQSTIAFQGQEPRLSLTFTCTVTDCHTRSTHEFSKRSYTRGIVIVQCPGCENRHLIADHIGWFKESTEDGKLKTVEDLVRAKGETVRRGHIENGEVIEYAPEDS